MEHWGSLIRAGLALAPWAILLWCAAPRFRVVLRDQPRPARAALCGIGCVLLLAAALWGVAARTLDFPRDSTLRLSRSGVLEADVERVVKTLTDEGAGVHRTNVHPLHCLLFQPIGTLVRLARRLSDFRAAQVTCTLMMFVSACALLMTVWLQTRRWWPALGVSAAYMVSFGFLWHSAVPESAALAAPTVIIPYLLAALFRGAPATGAERVAHLCAGVLSLGGTTTNLVHSLIAYGLRATESGARGAKLWGRVCALGLGAVLIGAALALLQARLYPGSSLFLTPGNLLGETQYLHGISAQRLLSVPAQAFGFALVGPRFVASDRLLHVGLLSTAISAELADPLSFPLLTQGLLAFMLLALILLAFAARRIQLARAVLLGLGFTLALHLVYGNEPVLYAGNWTVLLWLLMALGLSELPAVVGAALPPVCLALALNNTGSLGALREMVTEYGAPPLHFWTVEPLEPEAGGIFTDSVGGVSPGVGVCGLHFVLWDPDSGENSLSRSVLRQSRISLLQGWLPFPVSGVSVGRFTLEQALFRAPGQEAAVRVRVRAGAGQGQQPARLYVVVGDSGPAGARRSSSYAYSPGSRDLMVDGRAVLHCPGPPDRVIASPQGGRGFKVAALGLDSVPPERSRVRELLEAGLAPLRHAKHSLPAQAPAENPAEVGGGEQVGPGGNVAALCYELSMEPDETRDLWFVLHPSPQPAKQAPPKEDAPGIARRACRAWEDRYGALRIETPDPVWSEAFLATAAQVAMLVQENGKPVVSPVNYGVFTRDAVYSIYVLLMSGQTDLASEAISYLLQNPWSGRPFAEGDAPGQLLWVLGRYWSYTADEAWLRGMVPTIEALTEAVRQCRTHGDSAPEVNLLGHRQALKLAAPSAIESLRQRAGRQALPFLNYGSMDGRGVLYVNAFTVAGLREAVRLLDAGGTPEQTSAARRLATDYEGEFEKLLEMVGGNYEWDSRGLCCALWPCRVHELSSPVGRFFLGRDKNWDEPLDIWPYLDMDEAHNCLIAGQREAGHRTLERYFRQPSFAAWRTLDEGGESAEGYWADLATEPPWPSTVAMPHSWSISSLCALVRDSLVVEYDGACHLMSGVPPGWFAPGARIRICLPTEYGPLDCAITAGETGLDLALSPGCTPPHGFELRLPPGFETQQVRVPAPRQGTGAQQVHVRRTGSG